LGLTTAVKAPLSDSGLRWRCNEYSESRNHADKRGHAYRHSLTLPPAPVSVKRPKAGLRI
jgi:hypothetical protein